MDFYKMNNIEMGCSKIREWCTIQKGTNKKEESK
jgi:hypothetical protein